jgi:HlyD family type I secretion membrane fusion protein
MFTDVMNYQKTLHRYGYKKILFLGNALFVFVFGIVLIWSLFSKLDGGAYAIGRVIVENKTQTLQHLEGGVIAEILKRDGEAVEKGDVILILSNIKAKSDTKRLIAQFQDLKTSEIRLDAQRSLYKNDLIFPPNLHEDVKKTQLALYRDNKAQYLGNLALLTEKKHLFSREYQGLIQKNTYLLRQIELEQKLYQKQEGLVEKGFKPQNTLDTQSIKINELRKEYADIQTNIATTQRRIAETNLEIDNLKNQTTAEASDALKDIQAELLDVNERLSSSDDILKRTKIIAPITGIVTDLKFNTIGGVIAPATDIVSIVPKKTQMIIEARINPQDINSIHVKQIAKINFKSYRSVQVPLIDGVVTYVAADTVTDKMTGLEYYSAHIIPDAKNLEKVSKIVQLQSGMPADVTIATGERTPFDYFISPLRDSLRKSFTEE